ncbi:uncharacterized protein LY89DRAFT_733191 [Mollisia scopiformis]|uniref:Uncharacterized protein n=1 Tax=Mollisia scopiformis TaxID=149040 RepID=A0A194XC58_MOLSC|nr:uncharacterized protein LY89DRAFT_733191 [Mollisia scopiformis]KUJ17337.1 hypothetical protein LY89DRAFT_733191 [Mollisia scopiformis]
MPPTLEDDHFSSGIYNGYSQNPTPTSYNPNASQTQWYDNSTPAIDAPAAPPSTKSKAAPQDNEKLRLLPELRAIPWRKGKQCAPEKSTHSSRPQTRGAFLLVTRGIVRAPCTHCETGAGRFALCISLNDWYHGACATCVMATRGNKCSLRQDVEEGFLPLDGPQQQDSTRLASPDDGNGEYQTSSAKRKQSPTRAYVAGYSQDEKAVDEHQSPSQPTPSTNNYQAYNSTLPPQSTNRYPTMAPQQPTTYTPTPNPHPATQSFVPNDKSSLLDYVYQKQYPPNGKKRHHILHQAEREASQGTNKPAPNKRVRLGTEYDERAEASSSISPSVQLIQSAAAYRPGGHENEATPLIDTLSKKKQREIFGIIGGLQSGIRLVRQQTDSLQKQLDLLQSAFGIDLDEDEEGI